MAAAFIGSMLLFAAVLTLAASSYYEARRAEAAQNEARELRSENRELRTAQRNAGLDRTLQRLRDAEREFSGVYGRR